MRFSLEQLEAFAAAVDTGSFSAAARKLGKAQSRVSTAIANLEIDLGVTLFDRSGRFPAPTHEGERLLLTARDVLSRCHQLAEHADQLADHEQSLVRIAVDDLISPRALSGILAEFSQAYPGIDLQVLRAAIGDVPVLITSGLADVGLETPVTQMPDEGCSWRQLGPVVFRAMVSTGHHLAGRKHLDVEELRPETQIIAANRSGHRELTMHQFSQRIWQCEDSHLILELVRRGIGWAWLMEKSVARDVDQGKLTALPLSLYKDGAGEMFFFLWKKDYPLRPAEEWLAARLERFLAE